MDRGANLESVVFTLMLCVYGFMRRWDAMRYLRRQDAVRCAHRTTDTAAVSGDGAGPVVFV